MAFFQRYNKKIGAWVKMEKLKNGRVVIKNVKQSNPKTEFKGVPKK